LINASAQRLWPLGDDIIHPSRPRPDQHVRPRTQDQHVCERLRCHKSSKCCQRQLANRPRSALNNPQDSNTAATPRPSSVSIVTIVPIMGKL
jgi:hypothetical protein